MRKQFSKVFVWIFSIFLLLYPLQDIKAATTALSLKTTTYKGQPYIQITDNSKSTDTINSTLKQFAVSAAMQNTEIRKAKSEYWYKTTTKLMYNKSNKLSVSNETSFYSGGAHDQYWTDTYNFDVSIGKRIYLRDVLNSKAKISKAKEYISYVLSEKFKKEATSIFEKSITTFPLDTVKSPFYFRESGITVRFNPYEVGPFSEGIIDVTIPYTIINGQIPVPVKTTNTQPSISTTTAIDSSSIYIYSNDGKTFLGSLSLNTYDSDSIFNEYGDYGSKYAQNSIWNEYGDYGSKYSTDSAFNPYTTTPPIIVYNGKTIGYVSVNEHVDKAISPYSLAEFAK